MGVLFLAASLVSLVSTAQVGVGWVDKVSISQSQQATTVTVKNPYSNQEELRFVALFRAAFAVSMPNQRLLSFTFNNQRQGIEFTTVAGTTHFITFRNLNQNRWVLE